MSKWTLFSNHGHVLVVLSRDPDARLRDVAQVVGITERAVQKIVRDLQDGGLVSVTKQGRRNRYRLHPNQPLRHTLEAHCTTGELLDMVNRHAPGFGGEEDAATPTVAAAEARTSGEGETHSPRRSTTPARPERAGPQAPDAETGKTPARPRRSPAPPADDDSQGSLF